MNRSAPVNGTESRASAARDLAILLLAAALLFFWRLGSYDLRPPDELRFSVVAHEMREGGDYTVLSRNNRLYTDKPPLFFWAINLFGLAFGGVNAWSARLPSAAAGFFSLVLIYHLGTRLYDRRTGLLGALIFATALQIIVRARWASIDMTLNLFVLAAIVLLWRSAAPTGGGPWERRMAWCAMGLATLAKGPVGLVLPLLAVGAALLLERRFDAFRRLFLPSGVALYLLITLGWFGLFAQRLGWGTAIEVLTHQTVDRYIDAWNVRHPAWYYLWRFPVGFFPWSLFLPWAMLQCFSRDEGDARRRSAWFLAVWAAAIFLFFSFSTGKRGVYIIPMYPAAAILVARLFTAGGTGGGAGRLAALRRLRAPLWLWSAVATVLVVALPLAAARLEPAIRPATMTVGVLLFAGALGALILGRRGSAGGAAAFLCGSLAAMTLCGAELVMPELNRSANIRGFAEQVGARLRPEIPFGATEKKREAWIFYTGRHVEELDTREQILEYLAGPPPRDLLIEQSELSRLGDRLPAGTVPILSGRVSGEEFHLLRVAGAAAGTP